MDPGHVYSVPWPIMAQHGPSWLQGPRPWEGRASLFGCWSLGLVLLATATGRLTLDTKSCWVGHAGSFPGKEGNGTRSRQRRRLPVTYLVFSGQWGAWLLLYTVVMTVMTMFSCRISEVW